jgi:hypothetical protein
VVKGLAARPEKGTYCIGSDRRITIVSFHSGKWAPPKQTVATGWKGSVTAR